MSAEARLFLPPDVLTRISAHAARVYPEECCGVLVGRGRRVERIVESGNAAPGERTRRYVVEPEVLLAVHKDTRRTEEEVVGYYHSHPEGRARPSAYDLEHAWPGASYLIVGLDNGHVGDVRSWRLTPGGRFEEERWSSE